MNRKRHTRLKRRLSTSLFAVTLAFFATTCAPKPGPVVSSVLPKPPVVRSAGPAIEAARQSSAKADMAAAVARASVARTKTGLDEANAAMQEAVAESNRLRKQKHATENELVALYNRLVEQERRMKLLVTDIIDAEVALVNEKNLRQEVSDKLAESEKLIASKDGENAELRRLLAYSEQMTEKAAKAAQEAAGASEKLVKQVGVAEGRTSTWRWIAAGLGAAFAASVALHVLRSYMRI